MITTAALLITWRSVISAAASRHLPLLEDASLPLFSLLLPGQSPVTQEILKTNIFHRDFG